MFNDIEELTEEIEIFRSNIKESSDMFGALKNISTQIEKSKEDLDTKYNSFLKELGTLNDDINKKNDIIIKKNVETIKQQQSDFEKNAANIIDRLDKLQIDALLVKIERANKKIIYTYVFLAIIVVINIIILLK